MKSSIDTIRSGLVVQLNEINGDLLAAIARVKELRTARRQVLVAVKALGGETNAEPARPAPKKAQVRQAVEQLLADNGGAVAADDLEGLVADKLAAEAGCSAMGLALRMREVLSEDGFAVSGGQVRLGLV
jgi:hypothetical protein